MKALDHYGKADRLEGQQAAFDAANFSEIIINICHAAAHHLVCSGLEWQGVDPQSYGHAHSKHPSKLKQVNAPSTVQAAWGKLEQLQPKTDEETSGQEAIEARGHLAAIRFWAQSLRPSAASEKQQ